ncbi:Cytochrome b6-f complex subunit 6 (chloroplast) [Picochlorum sp. SENEW3]|nr:Cytochrome b6-f complex subunit 6 [Picochlorum sp. SENEW3]
MSFELKKQYLFMITVASYLGFLVAALVTTLALYIGLLKIKLI